MQMKNIFLICLIIALVYEVAAFNDPVKKEFTFDSEVFDLQFVGQNDAVILLQTKQGALHKSVDGAETFTKVDLPGPGDAKTKKVRKIAQDAEGIRILLIGEHQRSTATPSWISSDGGLTFTLTNFTADINDYRFHPSDTNCFLVSAPSSGCGGGRDCNTELYITHNLGFSFVRLATYVFAFDWGLNINPHMKAETIFLSSARTRVGRQSFESWDPNVYLEVSDDWFVTNQTVVPHGYMFVIVESKFMFVAVVEPTSDKPVVHLAVSTDGRKFPRARFPIYDRLDPFENSYSILDLSEGAVFLAVNHEKVDSKKADLYLAGSSGVNYALSLEDVKHDSMGSVDFVKVEGIAGVYLANVVVQDRPEIVNSVITFDKGGEWTYISAPTTTWDGKPLDCKLEDDCALHLHSAVAADARGNVSPPYSTKAAPGLIIASGNTGEELYPSATEANTYFSRDGGWTWSEVMRGNAVFEFTDHGALTLIASRSPTTQVKYSWTEGSFWQNFTFTTDPMTINVIDTKPGEFTQDFVIYGYRTTSTGVTGVLVHISFQDSAIVCTPADFETWRPTGYSANGCLLGREVAFSRRKQNAECFIDSKEPNPVYTDPCVCVDADWECDFGYERVVGSSTTPPLCRPEVGFNITAALEPPIDCPEGTVYNVSEGYRKIPGDECRDGVQHRITSYPCPVVTPPSRVSGTAIAVVVILMLALVAVGIMIFMNREKVSEFVKNLAASATASAAAVRYRVVANEDEDSRLMDDHSDEDTSIQQGPEEL
eukprot:TRINITY_DN4972_c0_g1_i1.p1 TRINITY_DN4972_c0_g1~~TRINITY_DN4972_c0_g1_i1.p1  ORF type:complete len:769 (+),score=127.86 TRINITY_DN4972_c0_g1_i1:48-2354(+)